MRQNAVSSLESMWLSCLFTGRSKNSAPWRHGAPGKYRRQVMLIAEHCPCAVSRHRWRDGNGLNFTSVMVQTKPAGGIRHASKIEEIRFP